MSEHGKLTGLSPPTAPLKQLLRSMAVPARVLLPSLFTPSPEAHEKIKKNWDGSQRSQESQVPFRGPLRSRSAAELIEQSGQPNMLEGRSLRLRTGAREEPDK